MDGLNVIEFEEKKLAKVRIEKAIMRHNCNYIPFELVDVLLIGDNSPPPNWTTILCISFFLFLTY